MSNVFNIKIESSHKNPVYNASKLRKLGAELERELETTCVYSTAESPDNTQAGDIVTALEIVSLSVSALTLIWAILKIRFRGSVTIEKTLPNGSKVTLFQGSLTDKEFEEFKKKVEHEAIKDLIVQVNQ